MNELYKKYNEFAEFFVVYIREAHPADSDWPIAIKNENKIYKAKTILDRMGNAHLCVTNLNIDIPCIIDGLDNATDLAYDARPDRIFIVDKNGMIAVRADRGPRGFNPGVEDVTQWLEQKFPKVSAGTH